MKKIFLGLIFILGASSAFGQTLDHTETVYTAFRRSECKSIHDTPSMCIKTELIKTPYFFEFYSSSPDSITSNQYIFSQTLFNNVVIEIGLMLGQFFPGSAGLGYNMYTSPAGTAVHFYSNQCGGDTFCNYRTHVITGRTNHGPLTGENYFYYIDNKAPFHVHQYQFLFTTNKQLWDQLK